MNIKNRVKTTCGIVFRGKHLSSVDEQLKIQLIECIKKLHEEHSVTRFIVDMSMVPGVAAAECILELSNRFPSFSVEAAIPVEPDYTEWEKAFLDIYFELLNECSSKYFIVSDTREQYEQAFNRYVAHNASVCISISNTFENSESPYVISVGAL